LTVTITNDAVGATIARYAHAHPDEAPGLAPVLAAAAGAAARPLTDRTTVPAHVTCAAVAVTPGWRVLQVLHRTTGLWLPPGGHVEPGDRTLVEAALREMVEETGVDGTSATAVETEPIDIDAHRIPPREDKGEPAHTHVDLRYLVRLPEQAVIVEPAEVRAARWLPVDALEGRLGAKLRTLRSVFTSD
jgi:8-oxo-dGTP pyrophosphatase MutT (NUDIX family)